MADLPEFVANALEFWGAGSEEEEDDVTEQPQEFVPMADQGLEMANLPEFVANATEFWGIGSEGEDEPQESMMDVVDILAGLDTEGDDENHHEIPPDGLAEALEWLSLDEDFRRLPFSLDNNVQNLVFFSNSM